ncbi:sulfotransferase [Halarcobacter sp.]|uniref:sulfotransferase n=1 Tax=Halarcobacter sp. TaxID=2321133 RepID=UPI003A909F67
MNKYLNIRNYFEYVFIKLYKFVSPFIRKWEQKYISKYGSQPLKHQPVFIIGAPRTGSTILYQTLTNQLDVLYIDNLVCKFYRNSFFGFWLSNKLFEKKAHNCFKSNHGDTSECGLHAPSECGGFWYRWLPTDRHFIDYDDITDKMIEQIRQEITTIINYFDKPLIFNNNNAGLRIRLLQKCFPNAKYIVADREPLFVAQSLLKARKIFYHSYDTWWSIMPKNYNDIIKEPYYKQVVLQHYLINKQIYADLNELVGKSFHLTILYKKFTADKKETIKNIVNLINYNNYRKSFCDNKVYQSKKINLDRELLSLIKNEIERLDWDDYKS